MTSTITPIDNSKPTINDVAASAGVSKKTVSRFINGAEGLREATREKVALAISELGYVPNPQARALALGRNFTIALLHDNPNAQTVLNFQKGILNAIQNSDLALMVRPVDRNSPEMINDVRSFFNKQRPLGVLILPPISEREDLTNLCKEMGVRYIRVGSAALDEQEQCVASNDCDAVAQACNILIAKGHSRIGMVRGPHGFRSAVERERGFLSAMANAKLPVHADLCIEGNYRFESGVAAGRELLNKSPRPTAIFASNDEMAAGVMHVALEMDLRVPRDLSIIGFDDSPTASHIWPSLTTVRWPITEMGTLAAQKLVGDYIGVPVGQKLPTTLESLVIERDSVAAPKN
jgi:LacI family transcriptional regulator